MVLWCLHDDCLEEYDPFDTKEELELHSTEAHYKATESCPDSVEVVAENAKGCILKHKSSEFSERKPGVMIVDQTLDAEASTALEILGQFVTRNRVLYTRTKYESDTSPEQINYAVLQGVLKTAEFDLKSVKQRKLVVKSLITLIQRCAWAVDAEELSEE
jgi:hypothetical protein